MGGDSRMSFTRRSILAVTMALLLVASLPGTAMAADLDYGYDGTPNPWVDVNTQTISAFPMEKGTTHSDVSYYDDSGDWVDDPNFVVNTTSDIESGDNVNPYSFTVTDIEDDSFGAFPRRGDAEDDEDTDDPPEVDNLASALDAGEWTKSGANKSELTISDTTTANNVEAVRFDTGTSMTSGDIATGEYANWTSELDSDESKRVLMLAVDVDTLDSGTEVQINVTDESGDYKQVVINSSENYEDDTVLANGTGDGYVLQTKLSDLTTNGGGSWDNIENITVTVRDGDFDGSFAWIDLEKKGQVTLGKEKHDGDDSDTDYDDTQKIVDNVTGDISVFELSTLDTEFDDAVIHDLSFPAQWRAQDLDADSVVTEFSATSSHPGYDQTVDIWYRFELPSAIDLSYSGVSLEDQLVWDGERYITAEYQEGVTQEDFEDADWRADDANPSSISGYDSVDDEVQIDGTVSSDTGMVVHFVLKLTDDEAGAMQATGDGAAAMGPTDSGSSGLLGGLFDFLGSIPGMIASFVTGVVGVRWWRNRGA